ncbi:MAG: UTRA domain-containing protein, partial [Spirochaetes bacterium]|nr:UTRA domain-containing protein [Spirochaetota bacterium]
EIEELARIVADDEIAAQLGIGPGDAVYRLSRRRLTDGLPLMSVVSFLPADLLPDFETHRARLRALRRTLEEVYGLCPEHVLRQLQATVVSPTDARRLDVPTGSPIQYIETHAYLRSGRCIEFSRAHYRGDRSVFRVDIVRGQVAGSASAAVHSPKTDTRLTES